MYILAILVMTPMVIFTEHSNHLAIDLPKLKTIDLSKASQDSVNGSSQLTSIIPYAHENPQEHIFELQHFCGLLEIHPSNCSCRMTPVVCQATFFNTSHVKNITSITFFIRNYVVTVIYTTIATMSSVFGMIGNAAVMKIAYKHREKLPPTKLHVAELAVVNFIFSFAQVINLLPLY